MKTLLSLRLWRALGLALALIVLLLDQKSKQWVQGLALAGKLPLELASWFRLVLVGNRGVSFGLLAGQAASWLPLGLTIFSMAVTLVLLAWLMRAREPLTIAALGFVMGGALGNILDRARAGAVTDFLDVHLRGYHWPAFNVADSCIFIGVVLLSGAGIVAEKKRALPLI